MLSSIKNAFARYRLKKKFDPYLSEECVNRLLTAENACIPLLERDISFVLIQFDKSTAKELEPLLESVAELAHAYQGVVETIISNFVVVVFGMVDGSPLSKYKNFVESALSAYRDQVRLVSGLGVGQVGMLGCQESATYSFIHPLFPAALARLLALPYGETHEVTLNDLKGYP